MPKLKRLSGDEVIAVLARSDFTISAQRANHSLSLIIYTYYTMGIGGRHQRNVLHRYPYHLAAIKTTS
jgi:hypothetical protein